MLSAGVRAARHLDAHRLVDLVALVEGAREFERLVLGVDQAEAAVVVARAGHERAHPRRGLRAVARQQRLLEQRLEAIVGHVRDQHVLLHRQPQLGRAVLGREPPELDQIVAAHAPDGHEAADNVAPRLALLSDADVVAAVLPGRRFGGAGERTPEALLDGLAEALDAPLGEQHLEPRLLALLTRAVVAEGLEDGERERHDALGPDEGVERLRKLRLHPPERAAGEHVEPGDLPSAVLAGGGHEREVVGLRVRAVLAAAADREVELARQVAEALAADDCLLQPIGQPAGVEQLVGVEAGDRAADHVADVVHAALLRVEARRGEALQDPGCVLDGDPAQLDVLARRDVGCAASAAVGDLADGGDLLRGQHAVGDTHAQHEVAGRRLAVEQAVPLEPLEVVRRDRLDALDRVAVEIGQDVEPVLLALQLLDLVSGHGNARLRCMQGRRAALRRGGRGVNAG